MKQGRHRLIQWMLLAGVLLPGLAQALGLGQLRVDSALNQRLDAQIELLSVQPGDLDSLTIRLATQSLEGNIDARSTAFNYRLESRDGRQFIRLLSNQPIREPLLNFLIELSWQQGRLLREVAIFLDPPSARPLAAAPAPPAPAPPAPRRTAPASPPPAPDFSTDEQTGAFSYAVRRGDTLWGIASRTRPDPEVGMQQMMQAIFQTNPQAFGRRNMDNLLAGATLRIPAVSGRAPRAPDTAPVLAAPPPSRVPVPEPVLQPEPPAVDDIAEVRLLPPEQEPVVVTDSVVSGPVIDSGSGRPSLRLAGFDELQARIRRLEQDDPGLLSARTEATPEVGVIAPEPVGETVSDALIDQPALEPAVIGDVADPVAPEAVTVPESVTPEAVTPEAVTDTEPTTVSPVTESADEPPGVAVAPPVEPAGSLDRNPIVVSEPPPPSAGGIDVVGWLIRAQSDPWGTFSELRAQPTALPLLGGVALLLLLLLVWRSVKRAQARDDAELEQVLGGIVDGSKEATRTQQAPPPMRSSRLDRVDFLLAAGSYREAENLIRLALLDEPDSVDLRLKMLEIHFRAGNPEKFAETAELLQPQVDPDGESWQRVLRMGRDLCPKHALFTPLPNPATRSDSAPNVGRAASSVTAESEGQSRRGLVIEFPASPFAAPEVAEDTRLTRPDEDRSSPAPAANSKRPNDNEGRPDWLEALRFAEHPTDQNAVDSPSGQEPPTPEDREVSVWAEPAVADHEVALKLELAATYLDMEDRDGARTLLEEIIDQGSDEQRRQVREMLQRLA